MAKPLRKRKQSKLRNFRDYLRRNPKELAALLVLILLVLIPLGIWVTVARRNHQNQIATNKEKAQYARADQDISRLASGIIVKFGKPDDYKKEQSCYYTSNPVEFERGRLVCGTDINIVYGVQDKNEAVSIYKNVESFANKNDALRYLSFSDALSDVVPPTELRTDNYIDTASNLECTLGYMYYYANNPPSGYPVLRLSSGQGILVELNCNGYPLAAYYPIAKN